MYIINSDITIIKLNDNTVINCNIIKINLKRVYYLCIIMSSNQEQSPKQQPTFLYWKICARAQTPMLMLHASEISYVWDDATANTWPEPKTTQPFGQLPVLLHGDRRIAQSGTITRYCAKLAGLWPENVDAQVKADMLIEHCNDIYNMFAKCKYAGDIAAQKDAWETLAKKKYPEHLAWLEKMLDTDAYFGGEHPDAGDIAVFSVLNLAERANIGFRLRFFPNLFDHSTRVSQLGSISDYVDAEFPRYFTVPIENAIVAPASQ